MRTLRLTAFALALAGLLVAGCEQSGPGQTGSPGGSRPGTAGGPAGAPSPGGAGTTSPGQAPAAPQPAETPK